MIGYLNGILLQKNPDTVILDVNGVGYEIAVPASSLCLLPAQGEQAFLYIHTYAREDVLRLFGFASIFERKVFETLITVSNVGPKLALGLLGPLDGHELCHVVTSGNLPFLTTVPGVGAKTAERLVVELKGKFQKLLAMEPVDKTAARLGASSGSPLMALGFKEKVQVQDQLVDDLKSALLNLGYKEKQIVAVCAQWEAKLKAGESVTLEQSLKGALKTLSGHILNL